MAVALALWLCHVSCAADRYVSLSGTNDFANKFTTWAGAATDIQWAVNFALPGETVWVSNGTYYLTNHVFITNGILLKSFSGTFADTTVNGNNYAAKGITNRCLYLNHSNAVVDGFTVTNGYVIGNGGGAYISQGTLRACLVMGNTASNGSGGGVFVTGARSLVTNCFIISNALTSASGAYGTDVGGGGLKIDNSAQAWNCKIMYNQSPVYWTAGGGVNIFGGLLCNSEVISNTAADAYITGGVFVRGSANTIRNCLIIGNGRGRAYSGAGVGTVGGGAFIENCTILANVGQGIGTSWHGGYYQVENTISYSNTVSAWSIMDGSFTATNCCFTSTNGLTAGSGNITNHPSFENYAAGNYRLARLSPCINAGVYHAWMNAINDLDNKSRADKFSGIPDIGCYEYHPQGLMFKVR